MSQALTQPNCEALQSAAWLLANREQLSLEKAATYLVTRMRLRTPLGAAEFLDLCTFDGHGRGAYDKRAELAYTCCDLYRQLFPREYAASQSPAFSTQREQEFYLLCNSRLFPVCISDDRKHTDIEALIEKEPKFFLPFIPLSGTQQHDWINGCCGFDGIQTVFKLALALMGHEGLRGWERLSGSYQIPRELAPAPLLAAVGWTHFVYSCAVDNSPLRYLKLAFEMVCYETGTPWLDCPPGIGMVPMEWSAENIAKLFLARRQAEEINAKVLTLDRWLDEDPAARIGRAVEMWNKAAEMERQSGYAGMYINQRGDLE